MAKSEAFGELESLIEKRYPEMAKLPTGGIALGALLVAAGIACIGVGGVLAAYGAFVMIVLMSPGGMFYLIPGLAILALGILLFIAGHVVVIFSLMS